MCRIFFFGVDLGLWVGEKFTVDDPNLGFGVRIWGCGLEMALGLSLAVLWNQITHKIQFSQ